MKDRWSQLSMSEKSDLMSLYIRNGISSLEEIKKHYNSFATGGSIEDKDDNPPDDDRLYQGKPLPEVQVYGLRNHSFEERVQRSIDDVNSFYYNDVVPRLLREHQDLDTKPDIQFPYINKNDIVQKPPDTKSLLRSNSGYATPDLKIYTRIKPGFIINGNNVERFDEDNYRYRKLLAHENTHRWQFDIPKRDKEYKKQSEKLLNKAYSPSGLKSSYGIAWPLYKNVEQEAVNRAARFEIWQRLKNELGRVPTIDEVDDYINNILMDSDILKVSNSYYFDNENKSADAVRQALIHVAQNDSSQDTSHYAALGGHLYQDGGPDDDKYSFLRKEPEVAVADNTRYVRPVSDVETDRASGLPEGTTTMRRIISAQVDRQQPVIKQDNATNETHKSINKEVKKAQNAKKVNDVASAVAAVTSIPATIVAPEVMTPIFALQGFNDATDVLSKEGNLNTEDYGRLGLDALFMLPMFNTAGNYLRFNTNLGRSYELSRALNKSIRNTELSQRSIENPANNRFRLGDVEINDPNLMYRQTDGRALGEVASGGNRHTMFNRGSLWYGIPTESMLNPVIEPKTVGKLKLTKPNSEVAKTHLLVTRNADMTGANQKFGRVSIGPHSESSLHLNIEKSPEDRWLNEMIREWRNKNSEPGVATYVTDGGSRRVPLEGALNNSNTSIYTFDSGYGYRKLGNNNILDLNDVLNTKISLNHVLPEKYLEPILNSKHQSLVIPSTADTPISWGDNPVLFFNKNIRTKYPHQSYLGDGQVNTVGSVWGDNTDLRGFTIEELQKVLDENAEIVKTPYLPWKSNPVSDREMIFSSRLRKYLKDTNPDMYIGPNYDEMHFHSTIPFKEVKYAFLPDPETAPKLLPYFDKFGIKTNFDFAGEEGTSLEKFQKWITGNDNSVGFKKGGKLK